MRFSPDPPSVPVNGTLVAAFAKAPFTPADAEAVRAQMAVVLTQPLTGFVVPPSDEVDGAIATDERVELAKTHTDAPGILRALADGRVRAAHLCKLPGVPPRLCMSMAVGDGAIPDLSRTQRQRLAELCARDEFLEARLRSLVHADAQAEYARAYVMERQLRDAYPQYASLTHAEAVARFATERSSALQQYVFARKAYEQQNAHARLAAQRATADVVTFDAPSPVHPSLVGPANGTHGAPVAEGGNDDDTDDDAQQKRPISTQQKKRRAPAPPAPPPITTGADVHAVGARASLTFQALQLSDGGRNFAPIQVATGECITLDMLRWRALVVPDGAKPPAAPRMYFCVQAPSGATHHVYVMASMLQRLIDIDDAGWIALRNAILLPDADGTPTRQLAGIPQYMMLPASMRAQLQRAVVVPPPPAQPVQPAAPADPLTTALRAVAIAQQNKQPEEARAAARVAHAAMTAAGVDGYDTADYGIDDSDDAVMRILTGHASESPRPPSPVGAPVQQPPDDDDSDDDDDDALSEMLADSAAADSDSESGTTDSPEATPSPLDSDSDNDSEAEGEIAPAAPSAPKRACTQPQVPSAAFVAGQTAAFQALSVPGFFPEPKDDPLGNIHVDVFRAFAKQCETQNDAGVALAPPPGTLDETLRQAADMQPRAAMVWGLAYAMRAARMDGFRREGVLGTTYADVYLRLAGALNVRP